MTAFPDLRTDFPLDDLNTFGVASRARAYLPVEGLGTLVALREQAELFSWPRLVLGGGSNLLLTADFPGLVLHMRTRGIELVGEDAHYRYVRAAAGENWHGFVEYTLAQGWGGLENLSLIPGTVGAAPIQNIGAYGVELRERFHSLTAFDLARGERLELNSSACRFGYRDSLFKQALRDAVILDVTFALPKQWTPVLRYADLVQELEGCGIREPSPQEVSDAVVAIRQRKLPDPARVGNAGSFFKNPVVTADHHAALRLAHPQLVSYAQPDGSFKLAAGWLIDQCGWKGKTLGRAGVYERQALVLVNRGGASGREVAALARAIQDDVEARFGVRLEPEPVFI